MKNKLLYSLMALCIGLFSACSQDDAISQTDGNEVINISAAMPQSGVDTRAMPTIPAGYQLRCILEVWDKANAAATKPITRIEKLAGTDNNGKFSFSFSVAKDVDYQCLLWADYIATDAGTGTTTDGNTTYADKHYNTASLKAVGMIADNGLFNNKACDAFCGAVGKSESGLSITLERPFAELTVMEKVASKEIIEACTGLEVSYDMPSGYNIASGTTTGTVNVNYSGTVPSKADRVWFSNYVFAPENVTALGAVSMTIKTATNLTGYKRIIPANALTLDKNRQIEASGNFSEDSNVDVDVDIDGGFTDPNAPEVGDYIYKDGTHGKNVVNAIGIIFAVNTGIGDMVNNYDAKFASKKIAGYAMALNLVTRTATNAIANDPVFPTLPIENVIANPWLKDYKGITYSNSFLALFTSYTSPLLTTVYNQWLIDNATTGENLSPWYIPSSSQLLDFAGMLVGYEGAEGVPAIIKNNAFSSAHIATAKEFCPRSNGANYLSSSITSATNIAGIQTTTDTGSLKITQVQTYKAMGSFVIVPVLTVFK